MRISSMLGGHSLLGTQLIVRVAGTFGVDLTLRSLFSAPTIRSLSEEIEQLIVCQIGVDERRGNASASQPA